MPVRGADPDTGRQHTPGAPGTHRGGDPAGRTGPQVERAVARVFSDLLGGPVEVDVSFFRLGASSLTLVLAHRRLAEIHPELLVTDLFAHPTVRELATLVTGRPRPGPPAVPSAAPPAPVRDRRAARARAAEIAR